MSYSISARAASKALALAALATTFDENVIPHQSIHKHDREQALATAAAMASLVPDDDTKDVSITLNGYLTWTGSGTAEPAPENFVGASVGATVSLVAREG